MFRAAFRVGSRILSDRVIAVADAAKDNLIALGMDEGQIEVIINGVLPVRDCSDGEVDALRERLGLTERHFVVGMPARLEHYKGQSTVLEAAALCKNAAPDMRFLLLGDGSQLGRCRELARTLDLEDRVRFCGFVDDLAPYYALMHLNVNASFGTETSSLSLSEGMSAGVPAVASRYGGNPRMIEEGVNGFLFPPHDAKALADLLLRLHADRALLKTLSDGAERLYRERFTADAMVRRLEGLYRRLLAEGTRRRALSH